MGCMCIPKESKLRGPQTKSSKTFVCVYLVTTIMGAKVAVDKSTAFLSGNFTIANKITQAL